MILQEDKGMIYGIKDLWDSEPLFTKGGLLMAYSELIKYADGDAYEDASYIRNFRIILDTIKKGYPLRITTSNRKGSQLHLVVLPERLEYSEKDDKFRLIGTGRNYGETINLGRITSCEPYHKEFVPKRKTKSKETRVVEFELYDERNV